jgi:hypothetical protein
MNVHKESRWERKPPLFVGLGEREEFIGLLNSIRQTERTEGKLQSSEKYNETGD